MLFPLKCSLSGTFIFLFYFIYLFVCFLVVHLKEFIFSNDHGPWVLYILSSRFFRRESDRNGTMRLLLIKPLTGLGIGPGLYQILSLEFSLMIGALNKITLPVLFTAKFLFKIIFSSPKCHQKKTRELKKIIIEQNIARKWMSLLRTCLKQELW